MIVEGVDALKGAIRRLSFDCPLIAVTDDNVKDRLLRSSIRYPAQKRQFGDDPKALKPSGACYGLNRRVVSAGKRFLAGAALRCL